MRGWHAKVNGLKRKAEKRLERQDKGIDEVEEGKQGNVIWKETLGRMGAEKRSERKVGTEEEGMKEKRVKMVETLRNLMMGKDDEVNCAIKF